MVNKLPLLVEAADLLQQEGNRDIKILVYGEGAERHMLTELVREKGLNNIIFKGPVEKKYVPYIVSKSDLNIVQVEKSEILKYGCSWNKMFDYFAAGKPVLSTTAVAYDLIEKYRCGTSLELQTPDLLAKTLVIYSRMTGSKEYSDMCKNARKAAFDYDFVNLTKVLQGIIEKN